MDAIFHPPMNLVEVRYEVHDFQEKRVFWISQGKALWCIFLVVLRKPRNFS